MSNNTLKKRVMRRVYVIYAIRQTLSPVALKAYVLGVSFVGLLSLVSVGSVIANMPADIAGMSTYALYALSHTEFAVQIFVALVLAATLWLSKDIIRSFGHAAQFNRV